MIARHAMHGHEHCSMLLSVELKHRSLRRRCYKLSADAVGLTVFHCTIMVPTHSSEAHCMAVRALHFAS